MQPTTRAWMLSLGFSVLVLLGAFLFDGVARVVIVVALTLLYFYVTRR